MTEAACTCDRARPETFDPTCPEHGEGTEYYREREAVLRDRKPPSTYGHHHDPKHTLPPPKYAFAEGAEDGRTRWDNKP